MNLDQLQLHTTYHKSTPRFIHFQQTYKSLVITSDGKTDMK